MNPFEPDQSTNNADPFSVNEGRAVSPNPFDSMDPNRMVREAAQEAKASVMQEAKSLLSASKNVSDQMNMAQKTGDVKWMMRLRSYAERILWMLGDFVKKAIHLAVCKLLLELCAMVISHLMNTLIKGGNRSMDITTPGVAYIGNGAPQQQQGMGGPSTSGNPFATGYDSRFSTSNMVSPW